MIKETDKELLTQCNRTVFDLSGSAATEIVLYNKNHEIHIHKVWVQYIEATSADTGIQLNIGSHADDAAYWEATSEVSQDAYYSKEYVTGDMTLAIVPKDTPIVIKSDGGKSGTGTAIVSFCYTIVA